MHRGEISDLALRRFGGEIENFLVWCYENSKSSTHHTAIPILRERPSSYRQTKNFSELRFNEIFGNGLALQRDS